LNFQKWEWLKVKEEEEDKSREMRGGRKKKRRYNAAVEQFRLDRNEVLRISETPFAKLVRKEVGIKKLLGKFHDDAELMRRKAEQNASGFNPFLAAETRHKDSATFTPEQKEWATVDKILNPGAWIGYVKPLGEHADKHKASAKLHDLSKKEMEELGVEETNDNAVSEKKNLLGMLGGRMNIASIALQANKDKKSSRDVKPLGKWFCEFGRDKIMDIWSKTNETELKTNDEERCYKLLKAYNGNFDEYVECQKRIEEREERLKLTHGRDWIPIRLDSNGATLETDIDARCRTVLSELDKTTVYQNQFMDSSVLHVAPQRFPTAVLRLELERELDRLLREQIYERERASKFLVDDSSDSDAPGYVKEGGEHEDNSDDDDDTRQRKAESRRKERRQNQRASRAQDDVKAAQKRILMDTKSAEEMMKMRELQELGFGGCLACKKNPCDWVSMVDVDKVMKRREQIADELNYIRKVRRRCEAKRSEAQQN